VTNDIFLSFNGGLNESNVNIYIIYMNTNSIIKKEVQTVSHNYIYIFFACNMFWLLVKTPTSSNQKYIKKDNLNTSHYNNTFSDS